VSLIGVFPRPRGLVAAFFRLAVFQVAVALALVAWAIWRLRPASRALYDVEGRIAMLRALRAAVRSLPRRRACGFDPVFWNDVYSYSAKTKAGRVAGRLVRLTTAGMLVVGTWWFAAPAFVELSERGYGPSAEAYTIPDTSPLARVIVERAILRSGSAAELAGETGRGLRPGSGRGYPGEIGRGLPLASGVEPRCERHREGGPAPDPSPLYTRASPLERSPALRSTCRVGSFTVRDCAKWRPNLD
jgi:hypothetical protein